jgi:hypothetical protein
MISFAKCPHAVVPVCKPSNGNQPEWHDPFLELLPRIRRHAHVSFRHLRKHLREEAIEDVIAHALQIFVRLWEQGRGDLAYATALARYGVSRVRAGRCVGGHLNVRDIMSEWCQRQKGLRVERLDEYDELAGQWKEIVVEQGRATPADIAVLRIDFANWLDALSPRERRIAQWLAVGTRTGEVAQKACISPGRVAQLRRKLYDHWCRFQGESACHSAAAVVR